MSDDLVERVGRELARTGYAFAGIDLTDPYTADADYWNSQARAAIAVLRPALRAEALEEAAQIVEAEGCRYAGLREGVMLERLSAAIRALVKNG